MERTRKTVFKRFGYYRCDDFAAYLTRMAAEGWHFKEWRVGLVFERGEPAEVEYSVDVFPDASEFDTKPDNYTMSYAEHCEAAGWELADARRKFIILRKVRPDASELLTPMERFLNIADVEKKKIKQYVKPLSVIVILRLLFNFKPDPVHLLFSGVTLLISVLGAFLLCYTLARLLCFYIWEKSCTKKIERGEAVSFGGSRLLLFMDSWEPTISITALVIVVSFLTRIEETEFAIFISVILILLAVGAYFLARMRPSAALNEYSQIAALLAAGFLFITGSSYYWGSAGEYDPAMLDEFPLRIEDIGGNAGEVRKAQTDKLRSILGTALQYHIRYEDSSITYYIYESSHDWVLDLVWNDYADGSSYQNGEDVTAQFDASEAIRSTGGVYLVRYDDTLLLLDFGRGTELSSDDADVIRSALL